MKLAKKLLIRMLPVLLIAVMTVAISLYLYDKMIATETEDCWDRLDVATKVTAEKVAIRFSDNMNLMDRSAEAMVIKSNLDDRLSVLDYIRSVQATTIFSRVDILLPDNTLLLQNGEFVEMKEQVGYDEMLSRGAHLTTRITDKLTKREVFYYFTPIFDDGEPVALFVGTIDCATIDEAFRLYSFDGQTQLYVVDRANGDLLLDNRSDYLGNIKNAEERKKLKGYEDVNLNREIMDGKTGQAAFYSDVNGKASYMCYMPVEGFNWEICVVAQEDIVMKNVQNMRNTLTKVGVVEGLLLVIYVAWNAIISLNAARNDERAKKAEMEQAANEAKARFLSSVSHDIRTPLNGIIGMLDIIKSHGKEPGVMEKSLHNIEVSAKYLTTLANDVLDLNELDNGKVILREDSIDLRVLAEDFSTLIQPRAKAAGVEYRLELGELEHPYVLGSAVHIQRVVMNLLTNAVKYNNEGGEVVLRVEEITAGDEEGIYGFTVVDNGIGISEEFQKEMFKAFEQEDAGARSTNIGHGLGLSIVSRLINTMRGAIDVESRKGEGSEFRITLPLKIYKDMSVEALEPEAADLRGARILLAEDNELNMEIAKVLLTDAGAEVTAVYNGKKAVEAFEASEPYYFEAILMDVMMPIMDGCEATAAIRAMDRNDAKCVPVLAMTATTFAEDIKRCKASGMDEHISKPLDMDSLIVKISRYRERVIKARKG